MRISRYFPVFLVCACVIFADAALVTINETIDISGFSTTPSFVSQTFSLSSPVTIASGDQVDMTVNFDPMQRLRIDDSGFADRLYGWLNGAAAANFTISNADITLHGFSGSPGTSNTFSLASQSAGTAHIGPSFTNFLNSGEYVEFSGYTVTYDVDSIAPSPKEFDSIWLVGNQASLAAVPEPHQYMMFGSFCLLGLIGRYGRQLPQMIRARLRPEN